MKYKSTGTLLFTKNIFENQMKNYAFRLRLIGMQLQ